MASSYAPLRVMLEPGPSGSWRRMLGGSISPCCRVDIAGRRLLYIVGAEGPRPDDGGPAWRRLGALELDSGGDLIRDHGPVVEHFPNKGRLGDYEEGIFCAAPIVRNGELRLYVGEVVLVSPGQVDVRTALWRSSDGLSFTRVGTIDEVPGVEQGPVAAYHHGRDRIFHFTKQKPGWTNWQLGVDGRKVEPRIECIGASGPFPLPGGRMLLHLVHEGPGTPVNRWWSFDPDSPWKLEREDRTGLPILHEGAVEPSGRAFVLDSWHDRSARIVEMQKTDQAGPIEAAEPHVLNSDPRAWPAVGAIEDVRFQGRDLHVRWSDDVASWDTYMSDGRRIWGHLCAVVRHGNRWVITGFEHLANKAGTDPDDRIVDTVFEALGVGGHMPDQMQLEGKEFQQGEELYLFGAAPCRIGAGAKFPQDEGLAPVRTRFAKVRWGVDGAQDAEPEHWWTSTQQGDDEMKLEEIRTYRGEIDWQDVEANYDDTAEKSEGEYEPGRTTRGGGDDDGEWLFAIEHSIKLFGGIPGGKVLPTADDFAKAKSHGQVQEATVEPYAHAPDLNVGRALPGSSDLHQLDPSGSFNAIRLHELAHPIWLPKGTRLFTKYRCSQKDRGAHLSTVFYTSKTDPRRTTS